MTCEYHSIFNYLTEDNTVIRRRRKGVMVDDMESKILQGRFWLRQDYELDVQV